MAEYIAEITWIRGEQDFLSNKYSRRHTVRFDAGVDVPGSSSPHVVPAPYSDTSAVDPEEMLVASLSSCHMLWFLSIAAKRKFVVDKYTDAAVGVMSKNDAGKLYMSLVTLRPNVQFSGEKLPSKSDIEAIHHLAHGECFIANSVRTEVRCEPVFDAL